MKLLLIWGRVVVNVMTDVSIVFELGDNVDPKLNGGDGAAYW